MKLGASGWFQSRIRRTTRVGRGVGCALQASMALGGLNPLAPCHASSLVRPGPRPPSPCSRSCVASGASAATGCGGGSRWGQGQEAWPWRRTMAMAWPAAPPSVGATVCRLPMGLGCATLNPNQHAPSLLLLTPLHHEPGLPPFIPSSSFSSPPPPPPHTHQECQDQPARDAHLHISFAFPPWPLARPPQEMEDQGYITRPPMHYQRHWRAPCHAYTPAHLHPPVATTTTTEEDGGPGVH